MVTGPAASASRPRFSRAGSGKLYWSAALLGLIVLGALCIPIFGPDPNAIHVELPTAPPGTAGHWLGTDDLGRDLLTRLAIGARISLLIGLATALVATIIGTLYGMVAAHFEGNLDLAMMRLIDVIYSLPGLMIVILASVFLEALLKAADPGNALGDFSGMVRVISLVMALAFFSWPDTARIIRGQMLALKREEFVEAFHSLGGGGLALARRHFLPNLAGLIILTVSITVPRAILTESTISFIGLGVEPPLSSWGTMASEGWQLVRVAPHMILFPAMAILITMVLLNLLGDGLREARQGRR